MNTKQKYEFADWMIHTVIPERLDFLNGEMKPESSTHAAIAEGTASLRSLPLIDNAVAWNAARPIILRDLSDLRALRALNDLRDLSDLSDLSALRALRALSDLSALSALRALRDLSDLSNLSNLRDLRDLSALRDLSDLSDLSNLRALNDLRDLSALSDRFEALYRGHVATAIERGYLSVPVVPQIDAAILTVIETSGAHHEQNAWHSACGTSHCRGGFAVVVAGRAGRELERKFGTPAAAALIYIASRPSQPIPNFYDMNNERVLADIKKCAAEQTAEANP